MIEDFAVGIGREFALETSWSFGRIFSPAHFFGGADPATTRIRTFQMTHVLTFWSLSAKMIGTVMKTVVVYFHSRLVFCFSSLPPGKLARPLRREGVCRGSPGPEGASGLGERSSNTSP